MSDAALDRDLQAMLAVDPPPEFVARVRARVAEEPHRSAAWSLSWAVATSAAVAAAALLAIVMTRPAVTTQRANPQRPAAEASTSRPQTPDRIVEAASVVRQPLAARPAAPKLARTPVERREPEILVDPREAAAVRALIRAARDGRIDLAPVLTASTPTAMELPPLVEISIPDLAIDPIAPAPGAEGVRQ